MKFRHLPIEVEAFQWTGDSTQLEDPEWICKAIEDGYVGFSLRGSGLPVRLVVETLEGYLFADPGDWIILGTKGEIYPCKPDIFTEIYEPVQ